MRNRHLKPTPPPVEYYCRHCGFGSSNWNGARVKQDNWRDHWGSDRCPCCGASTPPKKW